MTILEQIKDKLDILDVIKRDVDVVKKGNGYWSVCPFHQDENPSMSISQQKQIFKCFTCNVGGDLVAFYSRFHKTTFKEALAHFAKELGLSYSAGVKKEVHYSDNQKKMIEALNDAQMYFMNEIMGESNKESFEYLMNRNITEEDIQKFKIGFSPNDDKFVQFLNKRGHENSTLMAAGLIDSSQKTFFKDRIVFSIYNKDDKLIGFSGRKYKGDGPKYINSPETELFKKAQTLYGYSWAKGEINVSSKIYICEGFMDVIAMHKMGFENSVAIMGTALSNENLLMISNLEVNVLLDGDNAGQSASMSIIQKGIQQNINTFVAELKDQKDIYDMWNEFGNIDNLLRDRKSGVEYIIDKLIDKHSGGGLSSNEALLADVKKVTPYLSDIVVDSIANIISERNNISKDLVFKSISSEKKEIVKPTVNTPVQQAPAYEPPAQDNIIPQEEVVIESNRKNNWLNIVISSLLKNDSLVNVYENTNPLIGDVKSLKMINSIIDLHKTNTKIALSKDLKKELISIQKEFEPLNDEDDFVQLLRQINNASVEIEENRIKEELAKTKNPKLFDKLQEINRKKI